MTDPITVLAVLKYPQRKHQAVGEQDFYAEWGTRYVDRLVNGLDRHLSVPWSLTLLYDWPELPMWSGRMVPLLPSAGWWSKLQLFRPEVSRGTCLYLDLDCVVSGDLLPITQLYLTEHRPLYMVDDVVVPGLPNSSVMWFQADNPIVRSLWTEYQSHPTTIECAYSVWPHASDQAFIAAHLREHGCEVPLLQNHLPVRTIVQQRVELEQVVGSDPSPIRLTFGAATTKPHTSNHPFIVQHWR